MDEKPDICLISEANLWSDLPEEERIIAGFSLILPNTMTTLKHARVVLLVKNELNVKVLREHMDTEAAIIWIKIGHTKNSSLVLGGVYRQHHILGRDYKEMSRHELQVEQETRWFRVVRKWRELSRNNKFIVIGDVNLDHLRWATPEQHLEGMVDKMKESIESGGFQQLIVGYTRSWRNQVDSLLDQVWSNCTQRTVNTLNKSRASSDHNVLGLTVALKDIKGVGQNTVKRVWKDFNLVRCLDKFRRMNWNEVLELQDVNLANSLLEEKNSDNNGLRGTLQNHPIQN